MSSTETTSQDSVSSLPVPRQGDLVGTAKQYLEVGLTPIRLAPKSKGHEALGTREANVITADNAATKLDGRPYNLGLLHGPEFGDLVDTDFDWPEARQIGAHVFRDLDLPRFGRRSSPGSHLLAICPGVEHKDFTLPPVCKDDPRFSKKDGDHQLSPLQLRVNGLVVAPPSIHPAGEPVSWENPLAKLRGTEKEDHRRRAGLTAFLALVVRCWPGEGSRDQAALALAGALVRADYTDGQADEYCKLVAQLAADDQVRMRATKAKRTKAKQDKDQKTTGMTKLVELLGLDKALVAILNDWLKPEDRAAELLERFNAEYCVVSEGGKVRVLRFDRQGTPEFFGFEDFCNFHKNEHVVVDAEKGRVVGAGQWWTSHRQRRTYDGLCFEPGQGETVGNRLNLWRGFGVEPREGDWSLMQAHLAEVMSTSDTHGYHEEFHNYLYWWLAWAVQNPGERAGTALVFRGKEGSGRGTLGRAMCRIFDRHAQHLFSSEKLVGKFNMHLRNACFVFADEAYWPGDKRAEGVLKGMLTEPTVPIEGKGLNIVHVPNVLHLMMATNEEWSAPAGPDARRFAAQHVSSQWMQNGEYFKALWRQLDDGGLEAMLYDLLNTDLGDWHPLHYGVPQTEELAFQKEQTDDTAAFREKLEHFLQGACAREEYEGGVKVLCHEARNLVEVREGDDRNNKKLAKAMRELGFERRQLRDRGERGWFYVKGEEPHRKVNVTWDNDSRQWVTLLEGSSLADTAGAPDY